MARKRSLENLLEDLRQQLPLLAERYGVETLEVFGSYVRAEQKADSDLDVLVTFREAPSLLTFIAIENYLSDDVGGQCRSGDEKLPQASDWKSHY